MLAVLQNLAMSLKQKINGFGSFYMKNFCPKLVEVLRKGYDKDKFRRDTLAGMTVAVVSIPLAMALAIASGVTPAQGLYTAIVAGFFIALLGGSKYQIGGPTGAFVVVIFNVIKNYGPAAFENLLSGSENGVEFRMTQIAARYDLTSDEGRIGYAGEMAEELCRLENAVERDVYTNRAAQTAGLSPEAMKLEVQRAFKRRAARDRKARERQELNLTRSLQPADRAIRYDDLRSAMAEEGVIRLLMQDDSLFPDQPPLREDEFSSPLLGRIYGELWRCRGSGSSMAALSASLTPEEMSHLTTLLQKPESTANAPQALADYIRIIREEGVKRSGRSAMDALAAARDTYKDKKGYGGKRT